MKGSTWGFLENFYYKAARTIWSPSRRSHMQIDNPVGLEPGRHPLEPSSGPASLPGDGTPPAPTTGAWSWSSRWALICMREDRIASTTWGASNSTCRMPGQLAHLPGHLLRQGRLRLHRGAGGGISPDPSPQAPGGRLHINAKTSAKGSGPGGRPARRRRVGRPMAAGVGLRRTAPSPAIPRTRSWSWGDGMEDLESLKGKSLRLQFQLREAHLLLVLGSSRREARRGDCAPG